MKSRLATSIRSTFLYMNLGGAFRSLRYWR